MTEDESQGKQEREKDEERISISWKKKKVFQELNNRSTNGKSSHVVMPRDNG